MKYLVYILGFIAGFIGTSWLLSGCAAFPGTLEVSPVIQDEDPLAFHKNKMKLISDLNDRYGAPTLWWSYADDEMSFELFRWDLEDSYRYAIKVNGRYKSTWTEPKFLDREKEDTK